MAQIAKRRLTKANTADEDDIISHYGSISGETFASRRSRRDCSSLRMNSIDLLAKNLREYHSAQGAPDGFTKTAEQDVTSIVSMRRRFNQSFHHYRFLVVMMGGMSVGMVMLLRYNITIAILRMVNQTHLYLEEHPDRTVEDFLDEGYSLGGEFNWNNEIVQIILSWYMFSYTLPQMPSSQLAAKIGCRWSVPISLLICALASLLTPMGAYLGWKYMVALRLLNGLGASAVLPMLLNSVEIWMRYDEISVGLSLAQIVNTSIITLCPLVCGYLAAIHWSYAFYVPAIITLVFCVLWVVLVADSPEVSWFVSEKELLHIHGGNNSVDNNKTGEDNLDTTKNESQDKSQQADESEDPSAYRASSWLQIFKVPSFYAYILIWCCYCSSYSGFTFVLPTYMRQFLKIRVAQNGFYCFIIQIGTIISVLWPHPFLRVLQTKFGFSITKSRIIAHAACCFMVAATWIYVGAFHDMQLPLLFINRAFHSGNDIIVTGSLMSNYARAGLSSLAFSLVNTVGNLSIVFVSTLIGWILDYTGQSREGWCWIYSGLGLSQVAMFLIFSLFISSDPIRFSKQKKPADIEKSAAARMEPARATDGTLEPKKPTRLADNLEALTRTKGESETRDEMKK